MTPGCGGGVAAGRVPQKLVELTWPVCLESTAWAAGRGAAAGCLCELGAAKPVLRPACTVRWVMA